VCSDPANLAKILLSTRPPAFFGVPRIWEKFADGLRACVSAVSLEKQAAIHEAHALASEAYRRKGRGETVPSELAAKVSVVEDSVLRPLRAMIGLDALTWASSGAAPIPVDVLEYLGGFGIEVLEVWGMSETTGCATINTPHRFRLGAVGKPLPGVDVKLAEDGEIFVRGPIVFAGYLGRDGDIVDATDEDGWLATGDVGTIDDDGYLRITDRKKELIINSMGKNIAPSFIEGMLRAHPLVGHAIVVGDRKPYLTALIALEPEASVAWAKKNQIAVKSSSDLADEPRVRAELEALVATVNARLSRPEQVKRFRVVRESWLPGTEMITPTMKLRRRAVLERYAREVAALYESS
jgi:long-chain acyl-CoA synthetase